MCVCDLLLLSLKGHFVSLESPVLLYNSVLELIFRLADSVFSVSILIDCAVVYRLFSLVNMTFSPLQDVKESTLFGPPPYISEGTAAFTFHLFLYFLPTMLLCSNIPRKFPVCENLLGKKSDFDSVQYYYYYYYYYTHIYDRRIHCC